MNATQRNRVVGSALLVIAVIWSGLVYVMVPAGHDGPIGPRDFPLMLGFALAILAAYMVVWPGGDADEEPASLSGQRRQDQSIRQEVWIAGGMFLLIMLYGLLMEKLGFLIATVIIVVLSLAGLLGVRRPIFITLFALGIGIGAWLIFAKLLGAYLPVGSWYSIG